MGAKKRHRLSILTRIALLFGAAIILAFGVTMLLGDKYMMQNAADQAKEVARVAALAVEINIGSAEALELLNEDEEIREGVRMSFRYICKNANIRYLYLFTVEEDYSRRYIVLAAKDDADDTRMNEDYGFGGISRTPLHNAEINVLNGDLDGDHEFVDNDYGKVCMYIVPILGHNGEIVALIGVDYSMESIIDIARANRRRQLLLVAVVIAIASVIAYILIRTLVIKPIVKLSKKMVEFAENKTTGSDDKKRRTHFDDEVTDIEKSFDVMTTDITSYITDIERLTAERLQTKTELEVAKNIQYGIVPREHSLTGNGYELFGCENSAKAVGGDYYDLFELDEKRVCLVTGDVSGKGISAALFMVMVKTALREKLKAGCSLKDTLCSLNRDICISNPENMFSTLFCAVLDRTSGVIRYANAGHNPPVLVKADPVFIPVSSGTALGLFDDIDIEEGELQLQKGEGLLVYTDGITEAINSDRKQYGEERLLERVKKSFSEAGSGLKIRDIVSDVVSSVREFAGEAEQFDDITCTAVLCTTDAGDEIGVRPELGAFAPVKDDMISLLGNSESTREKIMVCEEMFVNIVSYSRADNVRYSCEMKGDTCTVTYSDNGVPFDPVNAEEVEKDFEDLDTGGMGIRLAHMYADEMLYSRTDDRNVLTLRFSV